MNGTIYYLAHPIGSRNEVREWELEFEAIYPDITIINPFYDNMPGLVRQDIEKMDRGEITRFDVDPKEIVMRDLKILAYCDAIIAIIDGNTSYGTIFEIAEATRMGMEVNIICTNGMERHPWLIAYSKGNVYTSFTEFEKHFSIQRKISSIFIK